MSDTPGRFVIVITPNEADAAAALTLLHDSGITAQAVSGIEQFGAIKPEELACVVLVEEALNESDISAFRELLRLQPPWSDLPVIFISKPAAPLGALRDSLFPDAGNLTVLERPFNRVTLLSAVRVALRARSRQFEVRALLEQRTTALKRRDEFLAILAHELRNPLAPLRNAAYLMRNLGIDDPVFLKTRGMVERQVRHMARLVDDLLDLSRLELGKLNLHLQRVDLNNCVAAASEVCSSLLSERGHHLELVCTSKKLEVNGDAVRLEQVMTNVIGNAAKFTPKGGRITVVASEDSGSGVVEVTDTGIGIAAESLPVVFDAFRQGSSALAGAEGGLGIGLTIVKRLVQLHGGSVKAHSAGAGAGSTFVIRLPLCAAPETVCTTKAESHATTTAGKRVLMVEDNGDIRESMSMLLRSWGHDVTSAGSGPEGINVALRLVPDAVLIDIGLPGFNGYEVARRIRSGASRWAKEVKLIAITGYGQAADRERAHEAGFDAHMLKPVDPAVLARALSEPRSTR